MTTTPQARELERLGSSAVALAEPAEDVRGRTVCDRIGQPIGPVEDIWFDLEHRRARLLENLDRLGLRWAIATSSRRQQVAKSVAALRLQREPIIVDGSGVTHAKPAPDLLLHAARELDVEPRGSWYVGDSTWDMRAAVAAEMIPIGVTQGAAVDADALRAAGAQVTLKGLRELLTGLSG